MKTKSNSRENQPLSMPLQSIIVTKPPRITSSYMRTYVIRLRHDVTQINSPYRTKHPNNHQYTTKQITSLKTHVPYLNPKQNLHQLNDPNEDRLSCHEWTTVQLTTQSIYINGQQQQSTRKSKPLNTKP